MGRGAAAVVRTVSCLVRTAGHAYCCGGPVQAVVDAGPSRNVAERAVELEWLHGRHSTAALQRRLASQAALRHIGHGLGRLGRPIVNCRRPSVAVAHRVWICALSAPGRMCADGVVHEVKTAPAQANTKTCGCAALTQGPTSSRGEDARLQVGFGASVCIIVEHCSAVLIVVVPAAPATNALQ